MSEDFDDVEIPAATFESLPPNQIRFRFMRIGVFVVAMSSLMCFFFSIATLADKAPLYGVGTLIFSMISITLQVMFILSIWWFKWFDFQIKA